MHRYQIRRLHQSEKLAIEFLSQPDDAIFREALSSVFCPLGYVSGFDGHYFRLNPGPSKPHEGKISVSSDEFGMIWCDGDPWGDVQSNRKWIHLVDSLLQASGQFSKTEP
ncbi:MAG: hypothetical protein PHE55_21355 [Methylococcaceae bacterium]|nr:hypothetical protein [Methylococcaceae bacterium]